MVFATSTLALLACKGCIGTAVDYPPANMPLQTQVETVPLSQGMTLATDGAFAADFSAAAPASSTPLLLSVDRSARVTLSAQADFVARDDQASSWLINPSAGEGDVSSFLGLTWSGSDAVQTFEGSRNAARLLQPVAADRSFNAEFALGARREETGLAFDFNLIPSLSYEEDGEFESRRVGAEIRLGRNFDQRGTAAAADSWYIFAGTEGEALVWEAGEYGFSNVVDAMALRDQVTVGDMQAGLSIQRGRGQLSLSYIRREVEWRDRNGGASMDEDFAGVSFTLKQ
ncbi:MAG: hypothetical protein AAGH87_08925 [Pseudomonadota bacterium]